MRSRHVLVACYTWYTFLLMVITCNDYKGFDDTVLFKLNWPGTEVKPLGDEYETVDITTHLKEKYRCTLPNDKMISEQRDHTYIGPTPFELVATLFTSGTCSYRIESYWTYEVCHGNYIKQFHEERDGKASKVQEYHLGKWDKEQLDELIEQHKAAEALKKGDKHKTIRIDGVNLPYLQVDMTDGTFCDLNNQHRMTTVQYVCYPHGKNEVYSLKEVSTCSYEVVILTPTLCLHPAFNPKDTSDNTISCVPLNNSPAKPRSLLMDEAAHMKKILDGTVKTEVLSESFLATINAEGAINKDIDSVPGGESIVAKAASKQVDLVQVMNFLDGKHCLTGGGGWWKYEFCYGRHVRQYHLEQNGETSLVLGVFDEQAHRDWLKENPQKRPSKNARYITHLYQGGSKCDETGDFRQTEVQLKCLENSTSKSKVSLYLMEPKTCNYILTVESPFLCDVIDAADEDGLITVDSFKEATVTDEEDEEDENVTIETIIKDNDDDDLAESLERLFN